MISRKMDLNLIFKKILRLLFRKQGKIDWKKCLAVKLTVLFTDEL
jgi:hypothetical protein